MIETGNRLIICRGQHLGKSFSAVVNERLTFPPDGDSDWTRSASPALMGVELSEKEQTKPKGQRARKGNEIVHYRPSNGLRIQPSSDAPFDYLVSQSFRIVPRARLLPDPRASLPQWELALAITRGDHGARIVGKQGSNPQEGPRRDKSDDESKQ